MIKQLLLFPIFFLLFLFVFVGCGKDDSPVEHTNIYLHDASVAYQIGDFDKAVKYYKLFINSNNNKDEALLQYVNLQLARISLSKGLFDDAIVYAQKVRNSDLFYKAYWLKEETFFDHTMKGLLTDKETDKINSFSYSLKNNAATIMGICYLRKGDYEKAINNFKVIKPESDGFYYLALAYGLNRDSLNERKYYTMNFEKGSMGLIETKEWLARNSIVK
jgi:tetratricopeptide (TPR) repeat protein